MHTIQHTQSDDPIVRHIGSAIDQHILEQIRAALDWPPTGHPRVVRGGVGFRVRRSQKPSMVELRTRQFSEPIQMVGLEGVSGESTRPQMMWWLLGQKAIIYPQKRIGWFGRNFEQRLRDGLFLPIRALGWRIDEEAGRPRPEARPWGETEGGILTIDYDITTLGKSP